MIRSKQYLINEIKGKFQKLLLGSIQFIKEAWDGKVLIKERIGFKKQGIEFINDLQ